MNKQRMLIIAGITVVIFVGLAWMQWAPSFTSAQTLSEQEARDSVLSRYSGEILQINLDQGRYEVELKLVTGIYELQIDAKTGAVASLTQKESFIPEETEGTSFEDVARTKEDKVDLSEQTEPNASPNSEGDTDKPSRTLSKKDAIGLALAHIPGELDDVDFKEMNGTGFYLVEIDLEDNREALVQIHAITGKIMSVSWDDDDDD